MKERKRHVFQVYIEARTYIVPKFQEILELECMGKKKTAINRGKSPSLVLNALFYESPVRVRVSKQN